jgi:hypothetical protein
MIDVLIVEPEIQVSNVIYHVLQRPFAKLKPVKQDGPVGVYVYHSARTDRPVAIFVTNPISRRRDG